MSHIIIIGPQKPPAGGRVAASSADVRVEWTPPHDITPEDERTVIERIERLAEKIQRIADGAAEG